RDLQMTDALFKRSRSKSPIFSLKAIIRRPKGGQTAQSTNPQDVVRNEEKELLQNGFYDEGEGATKKRKCKINRIPMITTAEVTVVTVHSPSFIFVRPTNHITPKLVLREPAVLAPLAEHELTVDYYVMCPIEDRAYGRARILKILPLQKGTTDADVLLILIDVGARVWAKSSALCSMDPDISLGTKDLAYHPWQIIAVSLAGIYPKKTPSNPNRLWSKDVRDKLQRLCEGYLKFKAKAITMSVTNNESGIASTVSLFGLRVQPKPKEEGEPKTREEEEMRKRMSKQQQNVPPEEIDMGSLLSGALPHEVFFIRLYDGRKQERFEMQLTEEEENIEATAHTQLDEFRKMPIPEWKKELKESEPKPDDWIKPLSEIQIKDMTIEWLKANHYEYESHYYMSLEGAHTISPWEFYGRPIKIVVDKKKKKMDASGKTAEGVEGNEEEEEEENDE
ncbi:hypothetical protein PFISCL1PPCAC_16178, partial [Pristionchus fissidentatus]